MFFFQCYPSGLPKRKEAGKNIFEDPLSEVTCIFSKKACFCLPYRSPFAFSKNQNPRYPLQCNGYRGGFMERLRGVEPPYAAWEAAVLPMNYSRIWKL